MKPRGVYLWASGIAVVLTVVVTALLWHTGDFRFGDIHSDIRCPDAGRDYDKELNRCIEFSQRFLTNYRRILRERVVPVYRDSFQFGAGHFSAHILVSNTAEVMITFVPDTMNAVYFEVCDYPVQWTIAADSCARLYPRIPAGQRTHVLDDYARRYSGSTRLENVVGFHSQGQTASGARMFDLGPRALGTVSGSAVVLPEGRRFAQAWRFSNFSVIVGEISIGWALPWARELSEQVVLGEIAELYRRSELFRQSIARKELRPLAEKIANRQKECDRNPRCYPIEELEHDMAVLQDSATTLGVLDSTFVHMLIGESAPMGALLWKYYSVNGFTLQWVIASVLICCIICVLLVYHRQLERWRPLRHVAFRRSVLVTPLAVSSLVFTLKPAAWVLIDGLWPFIPTMIGSFMALYLLMLLGDMEQ